MSRPAHERLHPYIEALSLEELGFAYHWTSDLTSCFRYHDDNYLSVTMRLSRGRGPKVIESVSVSHHDHTAMYENVAIIDPPTREGLIERLLLFNCPEAIVLSRVYKIDRLLSPDAA